MRKRNIILIVLLIVVIMGLGVGVTFLLRKDEKLQQLKINNKSSWKIEQSMETLGSVDRKIPSELKNEGLCEMYPKYNGELSGLSDEEKTNLYAEDKLLRTGTNTYNSMDSDGNLYLDGVSINRKLYKHTASAGMYLGDVADNENGVIQKVTICQNEDRNYITGVYAPAGEVIKIEISQEDLTKTGGLTISVGQSSHRNVSNTIKESRTTFARMPNIVNLFEMNEVTTYVGNYLGGPIYVRAKNLNKEYTVKISGAVKYPVYIHGYTTKEEVLNYDNYSAPYFDFELQDLGVRHSGPRQYVNKDFNNLYKCGELWKKICMTSRQVPSWSNKYVSVGFVYDPYVAAGAACAFTGNNIWVNAPLIGVDGALNYQTMTSSGFWGVIHEFNHHFQSYGIAEYLEVTNNATSLLSYVSYTNISANRTEEDNSLTGWNRYTNPIRSLRETISNGKIGQTTLNIYADIIHSFGVEKFILATQIKANDHTVDGWFEALCEATHYDMTYYFEELLGHTISSELKAKYNGVYPMYVPVATLYQSGRNFVFDGAQNFIKTVRPYVIARGEKYTFDFEKYTVIPDGFDFEIVNITTPQSGTLTKVSDKKYDYIADYSVDGDNFTVEIKLINDTVKTKNVTFTIDLAFKYSLPTSTKYTYDSNKYTSVDDAVKEDFEGYTNKNISYSRTTFLNGIGAKQIGVVEGMLYIPNTAKYTICLRAGRGKHALYLSYDGINYDKVLSFEGDKGGFEIGNGHTINLDLQKGSHLWYKQVTISNGHSDAFTELGWSVDENTPVKIPGNYLYNSKSEGYVEYNFESEELFEKKYLYSDMTVYISNNEDNKVVYANTPSWDNTTSVGNIVDGNEETVYHTQRNNFVSKDNSVEIVVDLKTEKIYNNLLIINRKSGTIHMPVEFNLYSSSDNENWQLLGRYAGLDYSGYTLSVSFEERAFRYYKIIITDTDAHINRTYNKYVSIAELQMRFVVGKARQYSLDLLDYYGFQVDNKLLGSFGYVIKGSGYINYSYTGKDFLLYTKGDNDCKLKITIDGKSHETTISGDGSKKINLIASNLSNREHDIKIEVLRGVLVVDSFAIASD